MPRYAKSILALESALLTADELRDILEKIADEIEELEPYATNSIQKFRDVAASIASMIDDD